MSWGFKSKNLKNNLFYYCPILKNYPVLNVLFDEVRELSASDKQLARKKYNKALKLLKRAS